MVSEQSRAAYRREGDNTLIEIRLREVRQLFHTLDPAPFREKDLDTAAEEYLVEACREAGALRPVRLIVYLPKPEAESEAARTLVDAIHHYFDYRASQLRSDIARLVHYGAVRFAIGFAFLIACLAMRQWLAVHSLIVDRTILGEGLLILGWVALWRPTEALLYDWWPLVRRRVLLLRLAAIPAEVRTRP
jgi:hypothetical protein